MRDRNAPLGESDVAGLAWDKMGGLIPAVVQDGATLQLLMLGYVNEEALRQTLAGGFATFYSRSKERLWCKGESSGNRLKVQRIFADCDDDAVLILATPEGPTCHLGTTSCFSEGEAIGVGWLGKLARIVGERAGAAPDSSYTARLLQEGPLRIAQKVGEEGVEVALAGVARDTSACIDETADLIYHLTVLMQARGYGWEDVADRLRERHGAS